MKLITGFLFLLFVVAPANAIAKALAASTLWSWFAASELGAGPSLGAWFGIALIFTFAMNYAFANVKGEKVEPDQIISKGLYLFASTAFGCGVLLASSYLVGLIAGWV